MPSRLIAISGRQLDCSVTVSTGSLNVESAVCWLLYVYLSVVFFGCCRLRLTTPLGVRAFVKSFDDGTFRPVIAAQFEWL